MAGAIISDDPFVKWTPLEMSERDKEWHETMLWMALEVRKAFGFPGPFEHKTGEPNPFDPPLSEKNER